MLNSTYAVIFGVIEGLTEFLPISSTAHLILAADFLHLFSSDYLKSFEIIIQLGAILAVVFLYFKSFLDKEIIQRLVVAFLPTGIIGFAFYKLIKNYLLGNISVVLWSLAAGGLILILLEKYFFQKRKINSEISVKNISYSQCIVLGLFQAIAMIPGISRSASTIVGGLFLKIPRRTIVEFSFLLAVPTMLAATGLDFLKNAGAFDLSQFHFLAVGFIASFLTALLAIRWLLSYIQRKDFVLFGFYRIALAILFLLFIN
jgi:undecaprenyl-diphosphatase